MRPMNVLESKRANKKSLENAKNEGRIEILTAICKLNKEDFVCKGRNGKGKDCVRVTCTQCRKGERCKWGFAL